MIRPYYKDDSIEIHNQDCLEGMRGLPGESVDLLATDPPYGISFMGRDWDTFNEIVEPKGAYQHKKGFKKLPRQSTASMSEFFVPIWIECLRVLRPGSFAFVMCSPRADVMAKQICCLQDAGFLVAFTPIFWAYASGFPKAQNISKTIDKQECRRQLTENLGRKPTKEEFDEAWEKFREVVGIKPGHEEFANRGNLSSVQSLKGTLGGEGGFARPWMDDPEKVERYHQLTEASTPQAKALDGSYGGFQPKPAVEVILVAMKPLSEKTFVDQALKDGKGITWLDDCRVPYESEEKVVPFQYKHSPEGYGYRDRPRGGYGGMKIGMGKPEEHQEYDGERECNPQGRFPANLLVSDDVLGAVGDKGTKPHPVTSSVDKYEGWGNITQKHGEVINYGDSGSFSRYFDLDKWWAKQIESMPESVKRTFPFLIVPKASKSEKNRGLGKAIIRTKHGSRPRDWQTENMSPNYHPTVKPIKLMAYLITLGSRPGGTVLDNFAGTGTTGLAALVLGRKCVMFESDKGTCGIAVARLKAAGQRVML